MVVYGQASGEEAFVNPQRLTVDNQAVVGFYIGAYFARRPDLVKATLEEIVQHVREGRIRLQVGAILPLSKAEEAHRRLETRQTTGKIVLQPWVDA